MWFTRREDLYKKEREVWGNLGFFVDNEMLEKHFLVVFKGVIAFESDNYEFEIQYPDGYPFISPSIKCLSLKSEKHQTPLSNGVCWHEEWKDYGIVTAEKMIPQLHKWLRGVKHGFNPAEESESPEPLLYQRASEKFGIVVTATNVYENWTDKIGRFSINARIKGNITQAELVNIESENQHFSSDNHLFSDVIRHKGVCFNVDETPPFFENGKELLSWLEAKVRVPDIKSLCIKEMREDGFVGPLVGIRYPHGGTYHFLVVALMYITRSEKWDYNLLYDFIVFESERFSEEHLFKRVSHLQPLQNKHVVIVGLGAIGSPIALELAKAGVGKMTFVDYDRVKSGNVVRHVTNLEHIGLPKVEAVKEVCLKHNPFVKITTKTQFWGNTDEFIVKNILEKADILICCTGHSPTERYLDDIARRVGIPVVYAYSSLGAVSGRIFLVDSKEKGCYHCHQYAIGNGSVVSLKQPETSVHIYEEGCAGPAFLGSGIDTGTIALHASRLTLQVLLKDYPEIYENATYNHMVWYSQNGNGKVECFQTIVKPEPCCPYCEVVGDIDYFTVVPEANELLNSATDLEDIMLYGGNLEEAKKRFEIAESSFVGQFYEDHEGNHLEILRVHLNEENRPKTWDVEFKNSNGEIDSMEIDTFFGYDYQEGFLRPRHKLVAVLQK